MDKIKNASQLAIIKKLIALGCSLLCVLLLFTKMLKYTATTTLIGGSDSITMSGGFSLFNFLFNGDLNVMDTKIKFLREMFSFSHVVMWISFCLCWKTWMLFSWARAWVFPRERKRLSQQFCVSMTALLFWMRMA